MSDAMLSPAAISQANPTGVIPAITIQGNAPQRPLATPPKCQKVSGPLKWHGGKFYLAPKIVTLMPPHLHYVEPFAGGLAVLLAKDPEGVSEVINDLDGDLMNFWRVLQQ